MNIRSFDEIYGTACLHKGGADVLESLLPACLGESDLCAIPDSQYLSAMSLRIFRAGLKHRMVDSKWLSFERVFNGFSPMFCAYLSDEFIEQCMSDRQLIRHMGKLKAIRANAQMVVELGDQYKGFGRFISQWPTTDIVGLWLALKRKGAYLGGASSAAFLRAVGKDTFLLTNDVIAMLKAEAIVNKPPSSLKDLRAVQGAFNRWQEQSGRPLCEISRIVSMTAQ